MAKAYYWHRFFSHQPDLNFDNPQVLKAVIRTMRFWLDMGVDGLRLDAIPYLVEREGTNNENLPQTHAVVKEIRQGHRRALRRPRAAGRGQPVAGGRARLFRRRRRMPHGLPLPADAAHVHGDRPAGPPSDRRDHAADARHPRQLPVGDLPAQPRRAHAGDGDQQRARLHVHHLRGRSARAHQPGHPPAARAVDGKRRRPHQADEQPAAVDAGLAGALLRRRDRHGRQHLPGRSQRRAHAHAVEPRPQRRLLARRSAAAVPAADHGSDVRLRGGQRRGAGARTRVAAQLDAAHARGAQDQPGVRARQAHLPQAGQPQDPRLPARARRRSRAVRGQPRALGAAGRAGPGPTTAGACRSS